LYAAVTKEMMRAFSAEVLKAVVGTRGDANSLKRELARLGETVLHET
jgi:hypothetical protein